MIYEEIIGDLFTKKPSEYYYAHCVAADCAFGQGIATRFVNRYPNIAKYCYSQNPSVGDAILFDNVYNLFTKSISNKKPTYASLEFTLNTLRTKMIDNQHKFLAIPQIGCGLDRLIWSKVQRSIRKVFEHTDITITVYKLE